MKPLVRILMLEMSHTLRDILEHAVKAHLEFELWEEEKHAFGGLTQATGEPDVVIFGSTLPDDARRVMSLCARWPRAQVVSVTQVSGEVAIYELRPHRTGLGQVSAAELVQVLCEAVHRHREVTQE